MKSARIFTAIAFAAMLSACGPKDLTKEEAKTLLNDYFTKNPTTQKLLTGMDNIGTDTEAVYFASPGGKYQKALEAAGLIKITSKGKIFRPGSKTEYFNALDIALTDEGKKFVTGKPDVVPAPSSNTWPTVYEQAVFCGKEVANIADVTTADDSATVDYTWKAANLTPFAHKFQETDPTDKITCNPAVVKDAVGTIVRKGEVWTVTVAQ